MITEHGKTASDAASTIECTLDAEDSPLQLLEWGDLQHHATAVTAIDGGATMSLPAAMVGQVHDLIKREAACCSFLSLSTVVAADALTLEVTSANPDALPVISMLAGIPLP